MMQTSSTSATSSLGKKSTSTVWTLTSKSRPSSERKSWAGTETSCRSSRYDWLTQNKALLTFKAAAPQIARESTEFGFELLGFDFMIDDNLNIYLIEVNENPCLSTLSERQRQLISSLVSDTMALTIDPLFGLTRSNVDLPFQPNDPYATRFELIHTYVDE